jgi:hypothetical protein
VKKLPNIPPLEVVSDFESDDLHELYRCGGIPEFMLEEHYIADSDDPGQGFQLKAATIPIEGGQYWPVGTFMGSQRW